MIEEKTKGTEGKEGDICTLYVCFLQIPYLTLFYIKRQDLP